MRPLVTLVTVVEGVEVQAPVAFLAGALQASGYCPELLPTDFCTAEESFAKRLQERAPQAVFFPYFPEFREIIRHLSGVARRALPGPVVVVGESLLREEEPPSLGEGVLLFKGDPGLGVAALVRAEAAAPPCHEEVAATLLPFGGARLREEPLKASLFGELDTLGLWAGRPADRELAPTALLARLEAPVGEQALRLRPDLALAPLEALGGALPGQVEWWDRHAHGGVLAAAARLASQGCRQSARYLPEQGARGGLLALKEAGIARVVFEADRLEEGPPLAGSAAAVSDLLPLAEEAREIGLEVGLLWVVGLPGEDQEEGLARRQAVRQLRPDKLRCIPFEPTAGHPLGNGAEARAGKRFWNRELHRPLEEGAVSAEVFTSNWAEAQLLLAEMTLGKRAGP